ncbi:MULTISPECIES: hypothetical protein [unclassified Streptomyces]|uniref:hypothetical protein n=1 Tax=unclassified Streptomyces TaxID=2593676 RepID=UPI00380609A2
MSLIKSVYIFPSNVAGFLNRDGRHVHHSDWGNRAVKRLDEAFGVIPSGWVDSGVDAIYVFNSNVAGFLRGGEMHHTDWGAGAVKPIHKAFGTVPAEWL